MFEVGGVVDARRQHHDTQLSLAHTTAAATSRTLWKAVAQTRSRAVFNGLISVAPGADQTEAHLKTANLLLSAHAEIDTKPELVIEADGGSRGNPGQSGSGAVVIDPLTGEILAEIEIQSLTNSGSIDTKVFVNQGELTVLAGSTMSGGLTQTAGVATILGTLNGNVLLQGGLLIQHGDPAVAEAFLATRYDGRWGGAYGTLPTGLDVAPILDRALASHR